MTRQLRNAKVGALVLAWEETGPRDGPLVVLLHGFPYDVRAYDGVVPPLAEAGKRVVVPYLRGYGPTSFAAEHIPRSGQQAALGADLRDLLTHLDAGPAVLAGYDWGGRAACVVAALWPGLVRGLVSVGGYNIQNIAGSSRPADPEQEHRLWYQYYLHGERGAAGLAANRRAFCRLLWRLWSPTWDFDDATYEATVASFDNPDFVAVVVQSYRHRFGLAPGDPALEGIERSLAARPAIGVPTIVLHGADDGVDPVDASAAHAKRFGAGYERRVIAGAGHNLPQEQPAAVVEAVSAL